MLWATHWGGQDTRDTYLGMRISLFISSELADALTPNKEKEALSTATKSFVFLTTNDFKWMSAAIFAMKLDYYILVFDSMNGNKTTHTQI